MFLLSDKVTGYIAIACLGVIALICIIMAIISSSRKRTEYVEEDSKKVEDTNENEVVENSTSEDDTVADEEETEEEPVEEETAEVVEEEETKEESVEEETEEENVEEPAEEEQAEETADEEDEEEPVEEKVEETTTEEEVEETETTEEETVEEEPTEEEQAEETDEEPVEEKAEEDTPEETTKTKKDTKPTTKTKKTTEVKSTSGRYAGKYVIMCENDQYRYQLFASNGQSLIISEGYTTEKGCRNGIQTVKKNITEGIVKIDSDKHDKYFFTLVSKQNRILCQSASYTTKESAVKASESFKKFALTDNIIFDENAKGVISSGERADVEFEEKDSGKYEIREDSNGNGFIYVLKASNNVEIVTSQDYSTYAGAKEAMERFREAVYQGEFLIIKDKNNNYQFKLYNQSKRLVVAGEVYESKQQVLSTIVSIKSFAKLAQLEDTSDKNEE